MLNEEKSELYPLQSGEWLGFDIDMKSFVFAVPNRKIAKFLQLAAEAMSHSKTSAREIARIAGLIISMEPGLGPLARFFTRKMYSFVDACNSWDGATRITSEVQTEIQFWQRSNPKRFPN